MKVMKVIVYSASLIIFSVCLYVFLLGNGLLDGIFNRVDGVPSFRNDPMSWYFLAKGMFCSLSLYLSVTLIDAIHGLKNAIVRNVQPIAQAKTNNLPSSTLAASQHTVVATPSEEKSWYQARQGVGH